MKNIPSGALLPVLLLGLAFPSLPLRAIEAESPASKVDRLMKKSGFSDKTPGCSVGIIDRGKTVFLKGYGTEDLEAKAPVAISSRTRMRINSLTKAMVSLGLLKLREGWLAESQGDPLMK